MLLLLGERRQLAAFAVPVNGLPNGLLNARLLPVPLGEKKLADEEDDVEFADGDDSN